MDYVSTLNNDIENFRQIGFITLYILELALSTKPSALSHKDTKHQFCTFVVAEKYISKLLIA